MVRVKLLVGDNNNSNFKAEVYAKISGADYLVFKDCMNICNSKEYDAAQERICNAIESQNNLPLEWYFDSDLELIETLI